MLILALNSGSSSLKCAAIDPETGETPFSATVERIGDDPVLVKTKVVLEPQSKAVETLRENHQITDHGAALQTVLSQLRGYSSLWEQLEGVGHRVVHGGEAFSTSRSIDDDVLRVIDECSALAPLHNPANLLGIKAARTALPHLPHVAVFDTAFHHGMPEHSFRYAVPEYWYREHGVRRYGFHGTSHRFVSERAAEELGWPLAGLNLLSAHLGNGCSATAVLGGRSVDTTMGFTPLEGLVMGTRSGDLDAGIIFHLHDHAELPLSQIHQELNNESGLLGLSGLSNDMRELSEAIADNSRARLSIEVFCHRLAKHLAGLATHFATIDGLVFTGGIGQNSSLVRAAVCKQLSCLGIAIDEEANENGKLRIESPESVSAILVIPTNEELMIARDTRAFVNKAES